MAHNTSADAVRLIDDVRPGESEKEFLPGMGRRWLLPLYDPFTWLVGGRRLHRRTVELAGVSSGEAVLDIGCGTGNLALAILRAVPGAVVTGLDPDPDALQRAARKARRRRMQITLVRGYADRLPLPDASQDHVVSSLALHHVPLEEKQRMAAELMRILKPGGTVTIGDLAGGGHGDGRHDHSKHRHGLSRPGERTGYLDDNADGGIERLLTDAGLVDARELERATILGNTVAFVQARRP
jgi:SAM-dependent methyltransferase